MTVIVGRLTTGFFGINADLSDIEDLRFLSKIYSSDSATANPSKSVLATDRELWLSTLLEHELRHYHDSLVSSHWLSQIILRNQCAINLQSTQAVLAQFTAELGCNCLPLPLRKWLFLDSDERQRRSAAWPHPSGELWRIVPLPLFPLPPEPPSRYWPDVPGDIVGKAEFLAGHLSTCVMGYRRLEELENGRNRDGTLGLKPVDAYEIPAIIVQLHAASQLYGNSGAHQLRHSIQARGMKNYAAAFLTVMVNLLECDGVSSENVLAVMNTLATWAMLGPPDLLRDRDGAMRTERELALSCPASRLDFAVKVAKERGVGALSPTGTMDMLDAEAGTMPFRAAIEWADEITARKVKSYADMAENSERSDLLAVASHMVIYRDQRHKTTKILLSNPDIYADPAEYLKKVASFPRPAIRLQFVGDVSLMEFHGLREDAAGTGILDWEEIGEERYRVRSYVGDCPPDVDVGVLDRYQSLQSYTDAILTGRVPPEQFQSVRGLFRRGGQTIFSV